ncbi:hypothetical protein ACBJ59_23180 [Nonomuraea sp. MTCD27]|uniref:hypothetical protein n=1 Tax=Nonomuraea sp. MTCD27 TaxID=1676747 RepID=UPI0035C1916B
MGQPMPSSRGPRSNPLSSSENAIMRGMEPPGSDEVFELGLDTVITGIQARLT